MGICEYCGKETRGFFQPFITIENFCSRVCAQNWEHERRLTELSTCQLTTVLYDIDSDLIAEITGPALLVLSNVYTTYSNCVYMHIKEII